jgi:hypothetical protein
MTVELIRHGQGGWVTPDGHWRVQRCTGPHGGRGWWMIMQGGRESMRVPTLAAAKKWIPRLIRRD